MLVLRRYCFLFNIGLYHIRCPKQQQHFTLAQYYAFYYKPTPKNYKKHTKG